MRDSHHKVPQVHFILECPLSLVVLLLTLTSPSRMDLMMHHSVACCVVELTFSLLQAENPQDLIQEEEILHPNKT